MSARDVYSKSSLGCSPIVRAQFRPRHAIRKAGKRVPNPSISSPFPHTPTSSGASNVMRLTNSLLCPNGVCQDGEVSAREWAARERERRLACRERRGCSRGAPSILASVSCCSRICFPRALGSLTETLLLPLFGGRDGGALRFGGGGCERL